MNSFTEKHNENEGRAIVSENQHCTYVRNNEPASSGVEKDLRFARPPWVIVFAFDGGTIPNYSAKMWQMLSRHFQPNDNLTRERLIQVRRQFRWSRTMMGAVLATAEGSIAKWEAGTRSFSGPTRRLINLLYHLFLKPEKARHGLDLIFWHRSDECIDFYQSVSPRRGTMRKKRE